MAKTYQIDPMTAPEGSDDYCLCDEQHATRWRISEQNGLLTYGLLTSRALAESVVSKLEQRDRAARFTWNPGDVEHHE